MRKLSIVDLATSPYDVELEPDGDFEQEYSMDNWSREGADAGKISRVTEDGNSFLRNTDRIKSWSGIYYTLPTNIIEGVVYKVTYDIRTSNPDDEMTVRAHIFEGSNKNNSDLIISGEASNDIGNEYEINNEWRHVESVFVASLTGKLRFGICGGQDIEADIKPFDIDNFKIIRLNYGEHPGEYTTGDFDDPLFATLRWSTETGAGKIAHVIEEDGNGVLRNYGRTRNYTSLLLSTPLSVKPGDTVEITFDVRTSNPGEKSKLRSNVRIANSGIIDLILGAGSSNKGGDEFVITNEWRHIEYSYTATNTGTLLFGICGAAGTEYIQDFDMDNFTVEIVG